MPILLFVSSLEQAWPKHSWENSDVNKCSRGHVGWRHKYWVVWNIDSGEDVLFMDMNILFNVHISWARHPSYHIPELVDQLHWSRGPQFLVWRYYFIDQVDGMHPKAFHEISCSSSPISDALCTFLSNLGGFLSMSVLVSFGSHDHTRRVVVRDLWNQPFYKIGHMYTSNLIVLPQMGGTQIGIQVETQSSGSRTFQIHHNTHTHRLTDCWQAMTKLAL